MYKRQEEAFSGLDTNTCDLVPLPSPVKHKTAFFWDATREVAIKPVQPSALELSREKESRRLAPGISAQLRRGRSAADFDAFEVDQLYWKTLLRYDRYDAEAARHRDVAGSLSPSTRTATRRSTRHF